MLENVAHTYSEVFAPEYFVLLCALTLILYEWYSTTDSRTIDLVPRLGVLALGWGVGLLIYKIGPAMFESVPSWGPDFTGSLGLGVGLLVIWLVWHLRKWGEFVPKLSLLLVAVTVPHLVITPFWDISSHVIYAVAPAGYLALVERRFAPFLIVPAGMVVSRPLADAHTWAQSVGGLVLAGVFVVGLLYRQAHVGQQTDRESATTDVKRL